MCGVQLDFINGMIKIRGEMGLPEKEQEPNRAKNKRPSVSGKKGKADRRKFPELL